MNKHTNTELHAIKTQLKDIRSAYEHQRIRIQLDLCGR